MSASSSSRRQFLGRAVAAAGWASLARAQSPAPQDEMNRFHLKYAPHPGMFKAHAGDDIVEQIRFAARQGFTAWEDNGMPGRPPEEQERIGAALRENGMTMGVFVAYGNFNEPVFVRRDHPKRGEVIERLQQAVGIAQRVGAKWMTVVPGSIDRGPTRDGKRYGGSRLREGAQMANAIELLRQCCEVFEPHGLVMVLEPLNWETNHGDVFLRSTDQAYALCKAVDSPACKILYDLYHEQITAGNLIPTMEQCWDEIAYLQVGDNPGRKEPGTGEVNYKRVFERVAAKSREIVIGMEHGNSRGGKEGEQAVIDAYRAVDAG